VIEDGVILFS